jgi:hypothetical protein
LQISDFRLKTPAPLGMKRSARPPRVTISAESLIRNL